MMQKLMSLLGVSSQQVVQPDYLSCRNSSRCVQGDAWICTTTGVCNNTGDCC